MGTSRTCGPRCHKATRPHCDCWCGGLFHGEAGRTAREAFVREFGGDDVPTREDPQSLFWSRAMDAAHAARERQAAEDLARLNAVTLETNP